MRFGGFNLDRKLRKITNKRVGDYWIKEIKSIPPHQFTWNAKEYNRFYNQFGYEFLPKLLDFSFRDNGARFKMEYINGSSPTPSQFNSALAYVSYKIIPSFYEYSFLKNNNLDKIYFHTDLNLENFLILDNKLYVVDIDLFAWKDKEY